MAIAVILKSAAPRFGNSGAGEIQGGWDSLSRESDSRDCLNGIRRWRKESALCMKGATYSAIILLLVLELRVEERSKRYSTLDRTFVYMTNYYP